MNFLSIPIGALMNFFTSHFYLAYFVLFFGSYLETIIGPGFFVPGEIFFLAGSILAGAKILNIWLVSLVCLSGGILGDSSSFFIGRRYGKKIFKENNRILNFKNYGKGKSFFEKYGVKAVFMARLLGPLSWITPFFAGTYGIKYKRFLLFNIPGVLVGIGQFMIVGYFFGHTYNTILPIVQKYFLYIILSVGLLFVIYLAIKRRNKIALKIKRFLAQKKTALIKKIFKHVLLYAVILIVLYAVILYLLFFIFEKNDSEPSLGESSLPVFADLSEIRSKIDWLAFLPNEKKKANQPINIIISTKQDLSGIFSKIGWQKNIIFSEGQLTFKKFISLTEQKILPVSDLYANGKVEDSAFQEIDNSVIRRQHIKLWQFGILADKGKKIYIGSASFDKGIDLTLYNNFIVPLHEIDPNVDNSRDRLLAVFQEKFPPQKYYWLDWGGAVFNTTDDQNFYTDGKILVLEFD